MSGTIDWLTTHRRVIDLLSAERMPQHYKQCYLDTVAWCATGSYGDKTNPEEKFRQHYAEQAHKDVGFVSGGYLVLKRWFPWRDQLSLVAPEPALILKGNCITSYDCGYEQALRQPHMKDWHGDASTPERKEKRRRAALAESHVKTFFASEYREFYHPPTNDGLYERPAPEDFWLRCSEPMFELAVDVTSNGVIRLPSTGSEIHVHAGWQKDETVIIRGFCGSGWVRTVGKAFGGGLWRIGENQLWSIEALLVLLNMARRRLDYRDFAKRLYGTEAKVPQC